jgi:major membrane immunogen (membrane-anchored lipoprotein)
MNISMKTTWLSSVCGITLLGGCCSSDTTQSTQKKTDVYVVDPFAKRAKDQQINMVGTENVTTLEQILHANHAATDLAKDAHSPHTLKDLGVTSLTSPSFKDGTYQAVYIDVDGGDSSQTLSVYLDQHATFTCLYGHNTDIEVRKGGQLSSGALNLNYGVMNIHEGGLVHVNSLRIGPDARIEGGQHLSYQHDVPGVKSIDDLQSDRAKQYGGWATSGKVHLEGSIDTLRISDPMTFVTKGARAKIGTLQHAGGIVTLSNAAPLVVDTYNVTTTSQLDVLWKETQAASCLTASNIQIAPHALLNVRLSALDAGVNINDTLMLMNTSGGNMKKGLFNRINGIGAQYEINVDAKGNSVNLVLLGRTDNSQALSATSEVKALSARIIDHRTGHAAERLSVMPLSEAEHELNRLCAGAYLNRPDRALGMLPLGEIMVNNSLNGSDFRDGLNNSIHLFKGQEGRDQFGGALIPLTSTTTLGLGVLNTLERQQITATGYSLAMLNGNGFIEAQGSLSNESLRYRLGYHMGGGICVDVQGTHLQRSGAYDSNLGYVQANHVNEFRGSCGLGLQHTSDLLQLSAKIRYEGFGYRHAHQMKICDVEYKMDGHKLPTNWQFELRGAFNAYDGCNVSAFLKFDGELLHHMAGFAFEWQD